MKKQGDGALRDIDTPHFSYFKALWLSLYSRKLYVDVGKRWKKFALGYLFLLMCLFNIPLSLRFMHDINHFFMQEIAAPIQKIPALYIQNGKLSTDVKLPYIIKDSKGVIKGLIDPDMSLQRVEKEYPDLFFLFTNHQFYIRMPSNFTVFMHPEEKINYDKFEGIAFDENDTQYFDGAEWLKSSSIMTVKKLVLFMVYPTLAMLMFAIYSVFYFAFALMGQFVAKLFYHFTISYLQSFRLLIVGSTLQAFVLFTAMAMNWSIKGFGIILLGITLAYFAYGVFALKKESLKLVHT